MKEKMERKLSNKYEYRRKSVGLDYLFNVKLVQMEYQ